MKLMFVSLGCDKNLVDSEVMLGLIREKGYELTNNEEEANIIVVNTCCFISDAKEESINTILEMAEHKKTGVCKVLIAAGCLSERYKDEIIKEIPEVDALLGTSSYDEILNAIDEALEGKKFTSYKDVNDNLSSYTDRINTTGGFYSYIKIAEGCDKLCTYCIIPSLRGKYKSRPIEDIVKEATLLVQKGIKEIILVAQDTTVYGIDLYGKYLLPKLLEELSTIEGLRWIRVLYCYPEEISDELLEVMNKNDKICNYLDIPIQHGDSAILKKMGRKTTQEDLRNKINRIRELVPDIALRTTIITGFPGETQEQHQNVVEFVKEMKFDRLGVFTYSKEEDTPAALLPGQITEKIKKQRQNDIMKLQQEISFEKTKEMIGRTIDVLIEGYLPEDKVYIGRSYKDAPNVDGYVFVKADEEIISGEMIKVLITESNEYDLIGEMI
ncbi:SSU ribosomal protein S12P methylthiotransferase [Natranaerovirga pectinivora]|uniref:Ribosomal protein uS12 methylthiotransferase RimO n=1 Tax=Natranaerovirga pectinivora TaxID=682400 RepID=A0A4R3MLQ7_9FIRM|nr:30S ribosomal protein S12 methylthiotransferase RimO [Natranaerovirga pectinivora]TCT15034.1 SSU ribosomal protein S12P methylthiotransferase [Natranaerovirga pectinivora]